MREIGRRWGNWKKMEKKKKKNFPSIVYRKYIIIRVYHSEASIAAS